MKHRARLAQWILLTGVISGVFLPALSRAQEGLLPAFPIERDAMTLSRLAQPATYFDKAGRRFAILGYESGTFEAWAYPLKILRNFELSFLLRGGTRPVPARDIVRFIEATPAATTLTFTYQSFTVKATFVTAVDQPGAVILLAVEATEPLTVIAGFLPVLQPMWPAGIGGQYAAWDDKAKAYLISEPRRLNHAYVGSPAAQGISYTPAHMLSDTPNEFTIVIDDPAAVRDRFIPIVLAGGKGKREDIRAAYDKIARDPERVYLAALEHYKNLSRSTLRVETPVPALNLALEWSKAAYDNLRVANPDLGTGLVAGLGASGTGGRPGFGWFFGVDAYLNAMNLSSLGDFAAAKEAISFTRKWQREDGKMAHELSQAAGYVDWFKDYPYGYIHADTTPYYIVGVHDYFRRSGDLEFVRESWPSLRRAFDWCLTTDADADGLMDNSKAGLGALEFGSLTGIQTDIYLAAVWTRAAAGLAELAQALGETALANQATAARDKALASLLLRFWDAEAGQYAYGFSKDGALVKESTPWCVMPLLWKMGPADRALRALEKICAADLSTGWGVRILSTRSPLFEPLNYNYGAVWPFLGGYAALALYNYDLLVPAYQLVLANAAHLFDNALGAPTELFSGATRVWPQEAVAHQGFSIGGFTLPFIRGLLGLDVDAARREAVFAPRFPGDWPSVAVDNFRVAGEAVSLRYEREGARISLSVSAPRAAGLKLRFAPVLAPGTKILGASLNGKVLAPEIRATPGCVQTSLDVPLTGQDRVEIELEPTVEILPAVWESQVGDFDSALKVIRQELAGGALKISVEGLAGAEYLLGVLQPGRIQSVLGADLQADGLVIRIPDSPAGGFARHEVTVNIK